MRCRGCRRRSRKPSCRIQGPWVLHGPCFEIPREIPDITYVLRDEETCCWLDEVARLAVGRVLNRILFPLAQKLQTIVELEAMSDYLCDFEIIGAGGRGNPGASLRIRRFPSVPFETRDVKIRVSLFISEVKHVRRSSAVVPSDLVRTNPTLQ